MADSEQGRQDAEPALPPVAAFYDGLAPDYHRLYGDWDKAISEQAQVLDRLLRRRLGDGQHRILDCAVGVGTQTLGLRALGHQLWGTDVSAGAVERARSECLQRALDTRLSVADMRMLPFPADTFDAVICADNAVAHLLSIPDVVTAFREMARVARPGGVIVVSARDYDAARRNRPPGTLPQVNNTAGGQTIAFQVWDWLPDGRRYHLQHILLTADGDTRWQVTTRSSILSAFTGTELVECAREAGLHGAEWLMPADTGFFQPLVLAPVMS